MLPSILEKIYLMIFLDTHFIQTETGRRQRNRLIQREMI